jgi:hypothetical protein
MTDELREAPSTDRIDEQADEGARQQGLHTERPEDPREPTDDVAGRG